MSGEGAEAVPPPRGGVRRHPREAQRDRRGVQEGPLTKGIDLAELRALAIELAGRAATIHREGRSRPLEVKEKSSSGDLVSQIDAEGERAIVDGLMAARPHDAILGEEGTDRAGTTGVRWIIDPLDGTANYVTGYPAYAVSIGVEVDGEPAVGVIADSVRGQTYSARRGGGATCDGRPLRPSERTDLGACLIATGFGYSAEQRLAQAEIVGHVLPRIADIRRSGSAAFDLAAVASGTVDGYYELDLAPWDVAAGRVIALEAGTRVELLPVARTDLTATIAAPPQLFDALLALLRSAGLRV